MRLPTTLATLLAFAPATHATESRDAAPAVFAPDSIAGIPDDGAAAFTPDGATVYFMRGTGDSSTLMESHREHGHGSTPQAAPFSGHWRDHIWQVSLAPWRDTRDRPDR